MMQIFKCKDKYSMVSTSKEFTASKFCSITNNNLDVMASSSDGKIRFYISSSAKTAMTLKNSCCNYPLRHLQVQTEHNLLLATSNKSLVICKTLTASGANP
mmetsp:Transcript_9569/g.8425  ORF Transcript_9569/g.8425 Transcript_9569/m.8425 type:complete len:101 (-) Transcript_9569:56-358(-)